MPPKMEHTFWGLLWLCEGHPIHGSTLQCFMTQPMPVLMSPSRTAHPPAFAPTCAVLPCPASPDEAPASGPVEEDDPEKQQSRHQEAGLRESIHWDAPAVHSSTPGQALMGSLPHQGLSHSLPVGPPSQGYAMPGCFFVASGVLSPSSAVTLRRHCPQGHGRGGERGAGRGSFGEAAKAVPAAACVQTFKGEVPSGRGGVPAPWRAFIFCPTLWKAALRKDFLIISFYFLFASFHFW